MALTYVKLANVTTVTAAITAGETKVVNLKGRILTATEVGRHLDGSVDGEAIVAFVGTDAER